MPGKKGSKWGADKIRPHMNKCNVRVNDKHFEKVKKIAEKKGKSASGVLGDIVIDHFEGGK